MVDEKEEEEVFPGHVEFDEQCPNCGSEDLDWEWGHGDDTAMVTCKDCDEPFPIVQDRLFFIDKKILEEFKKKEENECPTCKMPLLLGAVKGKKYCPACEMWWG
jgi:uncharacterized protein YbaR (Trm112 family)